MSEKNALDYVIEHSSHRTDALVNQVLGEDIRGVDDTFLLASEAIRTMGQKMGSGDLPRSDLTQFTKSYPEYEGHLDHYMLEGEAIKVSRNEAKVAQGISKSEGLGEKGLDAWHKQVEEKTEEYYKNYPIAPDRSMGIKTESLKDIIEADALYNRVVGEHVNRSHPGTFQPITSLPITEKGEERPLEPEKPVKITIRRNTELDMGEGLEL